ncbi:adhesin/hemagluttinin repeat domain protein [Escherichia coli STEC_94C]|nr:adhesin/hemagluttinin repeat domain protein [Escherichia coli STEC_94C]
MNRNCYRIIFNKARGMLMVVADIARSGRAGTSLSSRTGYPHRQRICRVTPLAFSLWLASGMVHSVNAAGIAADHGAPGHQQPTITQTAKRHSAGEYSDAFCPVGFHITHTASSTSVTRVSF